MDGPVRTRSAEMGSGDAGRCEIHCEKMRPMVQAIQQAVSGGRFRDGAALELSARSFTGGSTATPQGCSPLINCTARIDTLVASAIAMVGPERFTDDPAAWKQALAMWDTLVDEENLRQVRRFFRQKLSQEDEAPVTLAQQPWSRSNHFARLILSGADLLKAVPGTLAAHRIQSQPVGGVLPSALFSGAAIALEQFVSATRNPEMLERVNGLVVALAPYDTCCTRWRRVLGHPEAVAVLRETMGWIDRYRAGFVRLATTAKADHRYAGLLRSDAEALEEGTWLAWVIRATGSGQLQPLFSDLFDVLQLLLDDQAADHLFGVEANEFFQNQNWFLAEILGLTYAASKPADIVDRFRNHLRPPERVPVGEVNEILDALAKRSPGGDGPVTALELAILQLLNRELLSPPVLLAILRDRYRERSLPERFHDELAAVTGELARIPRWLRSEACSLNISRESPPFERRLQRHLNDLTPLLAASSG